MITLNKYQFYCKNCDITFYTDYKNSEDPILCPVNKEHEISDIILLNSINVEGPSNIWGLPISQPLTKPTDTYDFFTGRGDDRSDKNKYGTGDKLIIKHTANSGITKHELYVDLNCENNKTYIHNGWILYDNCKGEIIDFEVIPEVNDLIFNQEGTNYLLDSNTGLILPSSGAGNVELADPDNIKPLECLVSQVSKKKYPGFWDMDWDKENQKWINIRPNIYGKGNFNLLPNLGYDIVLDRFVNNVILVGSGEYFTNTFSTAQLGVGFRIKITVETDDTHDFIIAINLFLNRRYTI